jgi:subtilase family serine protease
VVSCGGTTLHRDPAGNFSTETGWSGSGGGTSQYEARPAFQAGIPQVGGRRGVPDVSFDADPSSGVSVFDSTTCQGVSGWMVFGGTSVSTPSWAGIIDLAGRGSASSAYELALMYANLGTSAFRDITSGTAGTYNAATGWDFVTGLGSNQGLGGK